METRAKLFVSIEVAIVIIKCLVKIEMSLFSTKWEKGILWFSSMENDK